MVAVREKKTSPGCHTRPSAYDFRPWARSLALSLRLSPSQTHTYTHTHTEGKDGEKFTSRNTNTGERNGECGNTNQHGRGQVLTTRSKEPPWQCTQRTNGQQGARERNERGRGMGEDVFWQMWHPIECPSERRHTRWWITLPVKHLDDSL